MDINKISNRTILRIMATAAGFVLMVWLVFILRRPLTWIGIAFFLALALNPAVSQLSKRMPKKSRGLAASLIMLLVVSFITALGFVLVPPLIDQTQGLFQEIPRRFDELQKGDNVIGGLIRQYDLMPQIRENQEKLLSGLTGAGGGLLKVLGGIFSSILAVFVVISLTLFMLKEGPRWMKIIAELQPPEKRKHREQLALQMYRTVSGYVTGNLITSFISATVSATALTLLGIDFAIPLGVLVGVFGLMPLIGATLGGTIVVLVTLFDSVSSALIMLVVILVYQEIENDFLQPMIYSRTVKISPLTVLVAALLGVTLAGVVGALVAIPTAASIQILIKDFLKSRRSKAATTI